MSDSNFFSGKNVIVSKGHLVPPLNAYAKDWRPTEVKQSLYLTLKDAADKHLAESGDWKWTVDFINGEEVTVKEAFKLANGFAEVFLSYGLKNGDCVHTILGNTKCVTGVNLGAWKLGACVSGGRASVEPKIIAQQLEQCEAVLLVCIPETAKVALDGYELIGDQDAKRKIQLVCLGQNQHDIVDIMPLVLEKSSDDESTVLPYIAKNPKKEAAFITWSSGTTGIPKGISHSHYSALNYLSSYLHIHADSSPKLTDLTFQHVGNSGVLYQSLLCRSTLYHCYGIDGSLCTPEAIFRAIVKYRPRVICLSTHRYTRIGESSMLSVADPKDLDCLEAIVPAGASVPDSISKMYRDKVPNVKTVNPYGLSEIGLVTTGPNFVTLGEINKFAEIKVLKLESDKACGPGETGEICAKSPFDMLGYLKRPKENEAFFSLPDGFHRTGDVGRYDQEGNLYYLDRIKELIKYKSEHVAPTELESIMQEHPAVLESLAFGRPDPTVQEIISMAVVLKPGYEATKEEELIDFVNDKVFESKRIRGGIVFCNKLPRSCFGKLVRRNILDFLAKEGAITSK